MASKLPRHTVCSGCNTLYHLVQVDGMGRGKKFLRKTEKLDRFFVLFKQFG